MYHGSYYKICTCYHYGSSSADNLNKVSPLQWQPASKFKKNKFENCKAVWYSENHIFNPMQDSFKTKAKEM